jgi:hypothetical protein
MPNTTNFNWSTPADTDLVKDGASAIRTLGNNIDTSLVDLKGGTTGQVLSKNSNTDLDFVWSSDQVGIPASIVDAKGDIIAATAADTVSRLAVGANDTVLMADSTAATGLKWGTVSAGSNWSLLNTGGTQLTGAATITVSGISGKDKIMVLWKGASTVTGTAPFFKIRLNTDTTSNYYQFGYALQFPATYNAATIQVTTGVSGVAANGFEVGYNSAATGVNNGHILLTGCNSSGLKVATGMSGSASAGATQQSYSYGGYYDSSSTISSVSIYSDNGNFDNGTIYIYTSA